jgi:hypothetical protein
VALSITKEFLKYGLVWQKQPGTDGDAYYFVFNPPFGTTVQVKSDNLTLTEGSLKASGIFQKDLSFYTLLK